MSSIHNISVAVALLHTEIDHHPQLLLRLGDLAFMYIADRERSQIIEQIASNWKTCLLLSGCTEVLYYKLLTQCDRDLGCNSTLLVFHGEFCVSPVDITLSVANTVVA